MIHSMNFERIRVGIEYKSLRKAIFFEKNLKEQELICLALRLFSLSQEEWKNYALYIQLLDCRVKTQIFFWITSG